MARIWDRTPGLQFSDSIDFTFGVEFSSDVPLAVQGVWFYALDDPAAPDVAAVRLYDTATQTQLASGPGATGLTPGWHLLLFDETYQAEANTSYTAAAETSPGLFAYDIAGSLPVTSPDGHVTAELGRFNNTGVHGFPTSTWDGLHEVDIEYVLGATAVLDGQLPALSGVLAGAAITGGNLAGALPGLGAQLAGHATTAAALAGTLPALGGFLTSGGITPGTGTPGGNSPTLTAAGTSPVLATAGTSPALTAGGTP